MTAFPSTNRLAHQKREETLIFSSGLIGFPASKTMTFSPFSFYENHPLYVLRDQKSPENAWILIKDPNPKETQGDNTYYLVFLDQERGKDQGNETAILKLNCLAPITIDWERKEGCQTLDQSVLKTPHAVLGPLDRLLEGAPSDACR